MRPNRDGRARLGLRLAMLVVLACSAGLGSCSGGSGGEQGGPESVTFHVVDGIGFAVIGATVYLVPAGDVNEGPIDGQDVLNGTADDRDEPLEDAVRLFGGSYPQGVTGAGGMTTIHTVPAGRYFWFVSPAVTDTEHLPGGSGCRISRHTSTFLGTTVTVKVSSQPSTTAQYVGSSACLLCHQNMSGHAEHAHRLGLSVPGQFSALQDPVRHPEFDDNWMMFAPAAAFTGGTAIYCSDYDPSRGFDKFKTSLTDPTLTDPSAVNFVRAWLWRDTGDGDRYKITLENLINAGDPPRTYEVALTYGGAVYKQRHLLRVPGRSGLYPLLQWQSAGDESRFDRTRKVYRDYHLDLFWNSGPDTLTDPPPTANFEASCIACHATGVTKSFDGATGEWLADAVDDPGGAFDIDGNGSLDEINIGCESCHGPGSDHFQWAASGNSPGGARFIVQLQNLSPSREALVCGRCHDRVEGAGSVSSAEPLNAQNRMPRVGISRMEFLAGHTTRSGPEVTDFWSDVLHSKSHQQHYSDFLKSTMHRNDRILTVCSDCHGSHGEAPFEHHLVADPADPNSALCAQCHSTNILDHMLNETGSTHAGNQTSCTDCHMSRTGKSGAGHYGILLGTPTGGPGDSAITYYRNDMSSHLFLGIPKKTHPDVAGVTPDEAMPVPYTRSCGGACHQAASLQFLESAVSPPAGFAPRARRGGLEKEKDR